MQQNKNVNNQGINASAIRSPELTQQPTSPTYSARNFPPHCVNPRFSLTPDTMGVNAGSGNQAMFREFQQPVHEPPLVDVKSYYERHNINNVVGNLSNLNLETNRSYHSTQSHERNTSYASINSEHNAQRSTLQTPPSANCSSQQWNFDNTFRPQEQIQQTKQTTGISFPALICSTQSTQPLPSIVKCTAVKHPCASQVCNTARKPSEDAGISICSQSPVCSRQNSALIAEIPTSYFAEQLKKYHSGSDVCTGDSAKINYGTLNNMFLKRLQDIDANVWGDKDLKLITFQEWVDMLLKINDSFITNMEELEKEVTERLELVQQKVNTKCRYSQGNELMKCRKDIETLLKILQNVYHNNNLDLSDVTFETISPSQILPQGEHYNVKGNDIIKTCNDSEAMQRNKLLSNIEALAYEVAEKHDEVRELKRQIICLEDDIQKAQRKIQLKDDVIKELRNDLKCANHKLSANNHPLEANLGMPIFNYENQTARSVNTQITDCNTLTFQDENNLQFDSLSHCEQEEQQKIKVLEEELNEFFQMSNEVNKTKMENQRKRLMDLFQAEEAEKAKAYQKLDFIRSQLTNLESNNAEGINDCDSGFHSKSENDQDAKILDSVRKRLRKLNETNFELKKKMQKLELENSELSTNLQSEKNFAQRNSETLKQIADLLGCMAAKQFSYTDIYNETKNKQNPFCEAINGMKKAFQEREEQLINVIGLKNKQIEELLINEEKFNEARAANMKDVFKTTITATPFSTFTPARQEFTDSSGLTTNNFTMPSALTGQQLDSMTSTFHHDS